MRDFASECYATAMPTRIGIVVFVLLTSALAGCPASNRSAHLDQRMITAIIVGSAESPDPILERVEELEREGKVREVAVMESFPVQIRLVAPEQIVNELNAMDRVRLPNME